MKLRRIACSHGFSLIETIVVLVVGAILASVLITVVGRSVERSSTAAAQLPGVYAIQTVMENIQYAARTNNLVQMSALIGPEGTSRNNAFGHYSVVHNRFIRFTSGVEALSPGGTNTLKVTIGNTQGDRLTLILGL
ncbi:MAG: type II secretion system protein [Lentisphaerae bacterium]|nr:type II secretion system protein [Lentisphaerota bacterium]